ncbi:hypothetical protein TNCV_219841 [Trichonephila clavipes]|nr:hypothetical protein TNCV_219841 [Trichonephila clavipes]
MSVTTSPGLALCEPSLPSPYIQRRRPLVIDVDGLPGLSLPYKEYLPCSLVVRASDSRPKAWFARRNCGGGDRGRVTIYRPFGELREAKSYCHLYGAQGQRQAYLLPMPR